MDGKAESIARGWVELLMRLMPVGGEQKVQPDARMHPPTAQAAHGVSPSTGSEEGWLRRAQEAYYFSTTYVDSNYRKQWEDSLRAFNNQHSLDSKYSAPSYDKRSHLFRPKTRSVIRKNEAAAAAAFFSNMDVVSIAPADQSNKIEVASAEVMKQLLQYRLTKSIPWYQTVLGGLQDAQTVGVVCAHVYWDFEPAPQSASISPRESEEEYPPQLQIPGGAEAANPGFEGAPSFGFGETAPPPKPLVDQPAIDLIPVENLRVDPGASWIDPIGTSPYLIHLIPMFAMDVRQKMIKGDWHPYGESLIAAATDGKPDSTRLARNKEREDPYASDSKPISDYEIVWVQRHIHRRDGEDWEFYTLSDIALLTEPRPLKESTLHGIRPYVMGCCILETHKIYPNGVPGISKELQNEANELANQRIDNVKFVLNKKWFVKRGRDADLAGLVRNVPGGVVMLDDPLNDVREITWPDVTQSAYEEQNRVDGDFNELVGNFSPAALMADRQLNAPARNMNMLSQSTGTLVEYLLRTFVETFVQPVLRHLVKLEQAYETDRSLIALAGKKAQIFQRFGLNSVTDEALEKEMTLLVNVGMGATDPQQKLQKFMLAMTGYVNMLKLGAPGINMQEVGKEIFGHLGYNDGSRFFTQDNPQVLQMQQQLQQAMQMIQQLQTKLAEKSTGHQINLAKSREANQTKLAMTQIHEVNENRRNLATHARALTEMRAANRLKSVELLMKPPSGSKKA